jgi:integrase
VQDVYTHLEKTLAPQTVSNIAASLDAAFNKALQWEMVTRNPCDGARPPRVIKRDPQIWTPDMLRHLLAQEPDPIYRALWVTVAVTGARIGEVLVLTWGDLDRETSTISITKSLTKGANGVWTVGPTKTRKTRVVAVSSLLWDLFDEAIASTEFSVWYSTAGIEGVGSIGSPHAKPSTLVFVNKHGRPISESMAYHAWQNAISRADVPAIHIHDLRHLHATSGLRLGIPLKVMSDRLGHADIGITANTYTHVQRDLQHDAADRIAAYLLGHEEAPSNE